MEWFRENGCVWLEMRCDVNYLGLMIRVIKSFIQNEAREVLGHAAVCIPYTNTNRPSELQMRQK